MTGSDIQLARHNASPRKAIKAPVYEGRRTNR
jgi:hypothetical protein